MLYCDECAEKCNKIITISKSEGVCELCGKVAFCNDY